MESNGNFRTHVNISVPAPCLIHILIRSAETTDLESALDFKVGQLAADALMVMSLFFSKVTDHMRAKAFLVLGAATV